jgi:dipeptidyl-peptidase-4
MNIVSLPEEVLGSGSALWFSPKGTSLAFATFNDNDVKTASYFHYGNPGTLESQYSDTINIRYPKVSDIDQTWYNYRH